MKELLDPICSIVWDMLANLCLFAQTTFTSKWLIILGVVFIAGVIFCGYYMAEGNEKGAPVGTAILAFLFFVALFVNILIMAFADFKEYSVATAGDDDDWIFVSVMCALLLCLVAVSIRESFYYCNNHGYKYDYCCCSFLKICDSDWYCIRNRCVRWGVYLCRDLYRQEWKFL